MNRVKIPHSHGTTQKRTSALRGEKADNHHTQKVVCAGVTFHKVVKVGFREEV